MMSHYRHVDDVTCLSTRDCLIFIFPMGCYGVCVIELSQIGKNSMNLNLVCEKKIFQSGQIIFVNLRTTIYIQPNELG